MNGVRFGFEFEVSTGAGTVLSHLRDLGATHHDSLCEYHCGCDACYYDRASGLFAAQTDETVNGEFITKILTYGSDEHREAVAAISKAALLSGAALGSENGSAGNHVHVNVEDTWPGLDRDERRRWAWPRLTVLVNRFTPELRWLASGRSTMRDYNGDPLETVPWYQVNPGHASRSPYHYRGVPAPEARPVASWLANKVSTVEFRMWNTTAAPWRLHMHIGLSIAFMLAAADHTLGVTERSSPGTVCDVLGPYMPDEAWTGVLLQDLYKHGKELA